MRKIRLWPLALTSIVAACENPTGPAGAPEAPPPLAAGVEAEATTLPGVHFAPPLAKVPDELGDLDTSLLDLLAVEVCAWAGNGCDGAPVARITASDGLRLSGNSTYHAVWHSPGNLDPEAHYRIRILASGAAIGSIDLDVVEPGSGPSTPKEGPHQIVPGQSLPIRFVIEEGVGKRVGSGGGSVELAGGAILLDVPAEAVPGDVLLTAAPAVGLPDLDPPPVPGTAWDFGPDGTVFSTPIVMTIAYDPSLLPAGMDESELRIHKVVDGALVQQDAGRVDLVNHTVSAEVTGFSAFVVVPRDPENPEDLEGPMIRSVEMLDPSTGSFGPSATVDVSAGDVTLRTRVTITDNIVGLSWVQVAYGSPTGRQLRYTCNVGGDPITGSDTNGEWECETPVPQHAESGTWTARWVTVWDKIGNFRSYSEQPSGFCESGGAECIADMAVLEVVSATPDLEAPVLGSLLVSADVQPRGFGPSLDVDASASATRIHFGFQATDDLSGVGNGPPFDRIEFAIRRPNGQLLFFGGNCQLTDGTELDGFWECPVTIPFQAEPGTWTVARLNVTDRAGNGGRSFFSYYFNDGAGQMCNNRTGGCVAAPTVEVVSPGDGQAPSLESVSIGGGVRSATPTVRITDDLSGVSFVWLSFQHPESGQRQSCFASLTSGTSTDGTWSCTVAFSEFAAKGRWDLQVDVQDVAGNRRFYNRRPSDGFLCYWDSATNTQVCEDFGDTFINLF